MKSTGLPLLIPTNRTVAGPRFSGHEGEVIVEYDFERENGTTQWALIIFRDVLAFEYLQTPCCRSEDVLASTEIRVSTESDWLRERLADWKERVGWQDWEKKRGGSDRFKHFTVFFDDAGCVNVVAAECSTPKP